MMSVHRICSGSLAFLGVDPPAQLIGKTVAVPRTSAFQSAIDATGSTRLGASMQVTGTDSLWHKPFDPLSATSVFPAADRLDGHYDFAPSPPFSHPSRAGLCNSPHLGLARLQPTDPSTTSTSQKSGITVQRVFFIPRTYQAFFQLHPDLGLPPRADVWQLDSDKPLIFV